MCSSYVFFVTVCSVCEFVINTRSGNGPVYNNDFVEMVKEDLRRNNDDYKQMKDHNVTSGDRTVDGAKRHRRTNVDSLEYDYEDTLTVTSDAPRAAGNESGRVVNTVREMVPRPPNENVMRNETKFTKGGDERHTQSLPVVITSIVKSGNETKQIKNYKGFVIPKFVKMNKIQKFKKFMEKNKDLLKTFLSSKMKVHSQRTTSRDALRQNDLDLDKLGNSIDSSREAAGAAIRNVGKYEKMNHLSLPSPEVLDMAPARGGRIHKQRVKGRLCQRHVLVPEGPKYDSQGQWYLPAHGLLVSRPYGVTRRPKLLLPRCCNCCKKSVLGCE